MSLITLYYAVAQWFERATKREGCIKMSDALSALRSHESEYPWMTKMVEMLPDERLIDTIKDAALRGGCRLDETKDGIIIKGRSLKGTAKKRGKDGNEVHLQDK